MRKRGLNKNKKHREKNFKHRYGITLDDYADMYAKQNGLCAICNYCTFELNKILRVDHCHKSGKVRALICHWCNTGLGMFKDNPKILKKAIDYLKKHK